MEEKAILFQAVVSIGESRSTVNAWFKIHPTHKISGPFLASQPPSCSGISSAFVDSDLYAIGINIRSFCIKYCDCQEWSNTRLPSSCVNSVLGVHGRYLCIFPGEWKYGHHHVDENTRKGYIVDTRNSHEAIIIKPPRGQWHRIRGCAALDEQGLIIAMDGEKNNFFLFKPEKNDWEIYNIDNPLPKFIGETSFAASNGRLYILEVQRKPPAFLYIYDIKEMRLVMDKRPVEFDDDLWSIDEWDRVVRLVPVADDELCFLWLGPAASYEYENEEPPVRNLHHLKFKVSVISDQPVKIVDNKVFCTTITNLLDCLPCDPYLFETKVSKDEDSDEDEPPVATTAARENSILFQAVVQSGRMNAWFKIRPTLQMLGPFHKTHLGMSFTFVGPYLYTIGGEVPFSRLRRSTIVGPSLDRIGGRVPLSRSFFYPYLNTIGDEVPFSTLHRFRGGEVSLESTFFGPYLNTIGDEVPVSTLHRSGYIGWLDTRSPFNGWEVGELPFPCVDPVICVCGDSLYILTQPEGYVWDTRVNECLETRIVLPKVEGEDQKQRHKIRACAALDGRGILIVVDGEKNNFFLYKPENNDWEPCDFEDPLPKFHGKTSFAASNGRLYIFEFPIISSKDSELGFLYIYNIEEGKLVINKKSFSVSDFPLLKRTRAMDPVLRLVPMADDKLGFLWFAQSLQSLYYFELKFSFNLNASNSEDKFQCEIDHLRRLHIENVTNLLDCLPCGPEQFPAEVEGKSPLDHLRDAFQKQREKNDS